MCIEDVRLARASYTTEYQLTVGTSLAELLPQDLNRLSLIIGVPSIGNVYLSINPTTTSGNGIMLTSGDMPLILDLKSHGDIVRKRFYAIGSTAGITITVWATTLDTQ